MMTTSSSTLKVGFAVAEEANALLALSTTKWALMNRIRNLAEHWSMLLRAATLSYSSSKYDIPRPQVDLQVAQFDARVYSLLKGMLPFLRIYLM